MKIIWDDWTQSFSEPDCKIYPTVVKEEHTHNHPYYAASHALVDNFIDAKNDTQANFWIGLGKVSAKGKL